MITWVRFDASDFDFNWGDINYDLLVTSSLVDMDAVLLKDALACREVSGSLCLTFSKL
jgi:hypothetical protein